MHSEPNNQDLSERSLRISELFTLAFGAIIGVSWIVLVGDWLMMAGPIGSVLAFIVGGLVVLILAFQYAELGSLFPKKGGELVYAYNIFGPGVAYVIGWILLLLYFALVAFEAVSVAWLLKIMFPVLAGPVLYEILGVSIHLGDLLTGILGSCIIAWINFRGAESAGHLQDSLTLLLIVATLGFVVFGFANISSENYQPLFGGTLGSGGLIGFLMLLATTPLFYAGFGIIPQALGEARPEEFARLGKIMLLVIIASIVFYLLVLLAVAGLVPQHSLKDFELPVAQALELAFNSDWGAKLVLFVGMLGLITTWNAVFFASMRVLEGLAVRDLLSPKLLANSSDRSTPYLIVVLVFAISIVGTFVGRGVLLPLISVGGLCVTIMFFLVSLASFKRRRRMTHLVPPYLAPGGIGVVKLAIFCSGCLLLIAGGSLVMKAFQGEALELGIFLLWMIIGGAIWMLRKPSRTNADTVAS